MDVGTERMSLLSKRDNPKSTSGAITDFDIPPIAYTNARDKSWRRRSPPNANLLKSPEPKGAGMISIPASKRRKKAKAKVRAEVDELVAVEIFVRSWWRTLLVYFSSFMLLGIPLLALKFSYCWFTRITHRRASLEEDNLVVLVKTYKGTWLEAEIDPTVTERDLQKCIQLAHRRETYILGERYAMYHRILKFVEKYGVSELKGCIFQVRFRRYMLLDLSPPHDELTVTQEEEDQDLEILFHQDSPWVLLPVYSKLDPVSDDFFEILEDDTGAHGDPHRTSLADEEKVSLKESISLNTYEAESRLAMFGENVLNMRVQSLPAYFLQGILHPFFIFQMFSCILWLEERYVFYALVILLTSFTSAVLEAHELYQNKTRLARLAAMENSVLVERDGEMVRIGSSELVPGDIIMFEPDKDVLCDVTLLSGSLLVNEASLTGEACPVRKSPWCPSLGESKSQEGSEAEDNTSSTDSDLGALSVDGGTTNAAPVGTTTSLGSLFQGVVMAAAKKIKFQHDDAGSSRSSEIDSDYDDEGDLHRQQTAIETLDQNYEESDYFGLETFTPIITKPQDKTMTEELWSNPEHVAFAGTWVVDVQDHARGVVIRTGASTVRGELVRDIIVEDGSEGATDRMHQEAFVAVGFLILLGTACCIWSYIQFRELYSIPRVESLLDSLDLLTIAVPPALPATVTFGLVFALSRLQKKNILCVRASSVSRAAWLRILCFDKTGTLTEEGLDVRSLLLAEHVRGKKSAVFGQAINTQEGKKWSRDVDRAIASCHSLSRVSGNIVGDEVDVRLFALSAWDFVQMRSGSQANLQHHLGNGASVTPLASQTPATSLTGTLNNSSFTSLSTLPQASIKGGPAVMFQVVDRAGNEVIDVLRILEFNAELARMGVIARVRPFESNAIAQTQVENVTPLTDPSIAGSVDSHQEFTSFASTQQAHTTITPQVTPATYVFVKGAPEIISMRCVKSTVPESLHTVLSEYAQQGLRILALAYRELLEKDLVVNGKTIDVKRIPRSKLEKDLRFLGLVILENRLKPDTSAVLRDLTNDAGLRSIMVTGDHSRTAVSVAKQCGILNRSIPVVVGDIQSVTRSGVRTNVVHFADAQTGMHKYSRKDLLDALGYIMDKNELIPVEHVREPRAQVAITGAAFRTLVEEYNMLSKKPFSMATERKKILFRAILQYASVFARMSATDKATLVRFLRSEVCDDVGMCGDGANDAAALKEACVGVSLCEGMEGGEATASLAAPLTSRKATIRAMHYTISEGRGAAASSLAAFKFMFLYSVIQLFSVILLYNVGSTYGDGQFLFVDLVLIIPLGILMGKTEANPKLCYAVPPASLSQKLVLLSTVFHSLCQLGFQLFAMYFVKLHGLQVDPLFMISSIQADGTPHVKCVENTVLWLVANFQYTFVCEAFNIGRPFRLPVRSNLAFTLVLRGLVCVCIYLLFVVSGESHSFGFKSWLGTYLQISYLPVNLRLQVAGLVFLNFIVTYGAESLMVAYFLR